ncbi:hypothetical protein ACS0TY_034831 [Phlomoides rotata]
MICKEVDEVIDKGVTEFDSQEVPSLHSKTLLIVGLCLWSPWLALHLHFRTLPICEAYNKPSTEKWQDKDLHETALKGKNAEEILQELCNNDEKTVLGFKRDARDSLMKNPLNWPAKDITANSMFRVSRTLLLNHGGGESDRTDEEDILAACLTNLAHVNTMKYHKDAIEEREKNVGKAALLLGETEEILALLQHHELPILSPDQAINIEDWRAILEQENKNN